MKAKTAEKGKAMKARSPKAAEPIKGKAMKGKAAALLSGIWIGAGWKAKGDGCETAKPVKGSLKAKPTGSGESRAISVQASTGKAMKPMKAIKTKAAEPFKGNAMKAIKAKAATVEQQ